MEKFSSELLFPVMIFSYEDVNLPMTLQAIDKMEVVVDLNSKRVENEIETVFVTHFKDGKPYLSGRVPTQFLKSKEAL